MKDEKTLLVLGASSDMGAALIREVAGQYAHILAHYNHGLAIIRKLQEEFGEKILSLQADFSDPDDVQRMLREVEELPYKPEHIVHFAAPKTTNKKFVKHGWEEYQTAVEASVHSFVEICQKCLPYMQKQHYGKIVVLLTSCTCGIPPKYQAPYVSAKYMLLGLVKALAAEYADKGITVNGVSPDMTETKFLEDIPELIVQQNVMSNPLGRNILVSDIVPCLDYLLSDGADAVTGQNIVISGGKV